MNDDVAELMRSFGASDAAVAAVSDGPLGLPYAVSVVVRLSDAIVDEIAPESSLGVGPTYTYFNHYRSVNYLIDQVLLRSGLYLQSRGARYCTVAASQSRPDEPFAGRYSHKKAACLAGLGTVGRNGLFLHREWGPRVRLGTLFTDWSGWRIESVAPSLTEGALVDAGCAACGLCAAACPSGAIGATARGGEIPDHGERVAQERASRDRLVAFDPALCSAWMKKNYQDIGRGSVCGICMAVCPRHIRPRKTS